MAAIVEDAPPPTAVSRVLNPLMLAVLRSPLSKAIRPLAVLEFRGRRSGTLRRIVVGWHNLAGTPTVVTPARWRANFDGGHPVTVRWRGHTAAFTGSLETDPVTVAVAINQLLSAGLSPRALALKVPAGHDVTAEDVLHTRRALLSFVPAPT